MKLVVLGGGGTRAPILYKGILDAFKNIGISEVVFYDIDEKRLTLMRKVIEGIAEGQEHPHTYFSTNRTNLFKDADFVFCAIRVGEEDARIIDETIPLKYGVIGQETVGPGGMMMALRTIPVLLDYARQIENEAPNAWFVNFTNPSGIITQALTNHSNLRVIGICDAPNMILDVSAKLLKKSEEELFMHYIGLNHLGWAVDIKDEYGGLMDELSKRFEEFSNIESVFGNFSSDYVNVNKAIPNEYIFFYAYEQDALKTMLASEETRGESIKRFNRQLFSQLEQVETSKEAIEVYNNYISEREGTYFKRETGKERNVSRFDLRNFRLKSGYEKIALGVLESLSTGKPNFIPVNIKNNGNIPWLRDCDVIEVTSLINRTGANPIKVTLPERFFGLVYSAKLYERMVVSAAINQSYSQALEAMRLNPFVHSEKSAKKILDDFIEELGNLVNLQ